MKVQAMDSSLRNYIEREPRRKMERYRGARLTLVRMGILVVVASFGCQPSARQDEPRPTAILFDIFHINYAWGFSCKGCYVDVAGSVWRYDCAGLRDTLRATEWRGRESELIKRRFDMNNDVLCQIGEEELEAMRALADVAAKTPVGDPVHTSVDAGASSYSAYLYDARDGAPTEVILAMTGDFSRSPSTVEATRLVEWLESKCACEDSVNPH